MEYNRKYKVTDYGVRTELNRLLLNDISDIYGQYEKDLPILAQLANDENAMEIICETINEQAKLQGRHKIDKNSVGALFSIHSKHQNRSMEMFDSIRCNLVAAGEPHETCLEPPPILYFDGTQLINSLLGLIVIPAERFGLAYSDDRFREKDSERSEELIRIIKKLTKEKWNGESGFFCNYPDRQNKNKSKFIHYEFDDDDRYLISHFLKRMRDALSHSGQGDIHFFPLTEGGEGHNDNEPITHIAFIDMRNDKKTGEKYRFYIKISIPDLIEITKLLTGSYALIEKEEADELLNCEVCNKSNKSSYMYHSEFVHELNEILAQN